VFARTITGSETAAPTSSGSMAGRSKYSPGAMGTDPARQTIPGGFSDPLRAYVTITTNRSDSSNVGFAPSRRTGVNYTDDSRCPSSGRVRPRQTFTSSLARRRPGFSGLFSRRTVRSYPLPQTTKVIILSGRWRHGIYFPEFRSPVKRTFFSLCSLRFGAASVGLTFTSLPRANDFPIVLRLTDILLVSDSFHVLL